MPRPGSLANLVFELEIITGGTTVTVPAHQFLQSIEIEASVGSTYTGSITLFDPEGEFLDVMATLIEAYEAKQFPMEAPNAIQAIK